MAMQHRAMEHILHHVMADTRSGKRQDSHAEPDMLGAYKGKAGPLHECHRRQQDEHLIVKNPRQDFLITAPFDRTRLETRERPGAIQPQEPQAKPMKNDHLYDPYRQKKRHD
jgi:hypothetical protein